MDLLVPTLFGDTVDLAEDGGDLTSLSCDLGLLSGLDLAFTLCGDGVEGSNLWLDVDLDYSEAQTFLVVLELLSVSLEVSNLSCSEFAYPYSPTIAGPLTQCGPAGHLQFFM